MSIPLDKTFRDKYYVGKVKDYNPKFVYDDDFYNDCCEIIEKYFNKNSSRKMRDRPIRYLDVTILTIVWIYSYMILLKTRKTWTYV